MPENPPLSLDLERRCNHFELRLEDGVAQGKHLCLNVSTTMYTDLSFVDHHGLRGQPMFVVRPHRVF